MRVRSGYDARILCVVLVRWMADNELERKNKITRRLLHTEWSRSCIMKIIDLQRLKSFSSRCEILIALYDGFIWISRYKNDVSMLCPLLQCSKRDSVHSVYTINYYIRANRPWPWADCLSLPCSYNIYNTRTYFNYSYTNTGRYGVLCTRAVHMIKIYVINTDRLIKQDNIIIYFFLFFKTGFITIFLSELFYFIIAILWAKYFINSTQVFCIGKLLEIKLF